MSRGDKCKCSKVDGIDTVEKGGRKLKPEIYRDNRESVACQMNC